MHCPICGETMEHMGRGMMVEDHDYGCFKCNIVITKKGNFGGPTGDTKRHHLSYQKYKEWKKEKEKK